MPILPEKSLEYLRQDTRGRTMVPIRKNKCDNMQEMV